MPRAAARDAPRIARGCARSRWPSPATSIRSTTCACCCTCSDALRGRPGRARRVVPALDPRGLRRRSSASSRRAPPAASASATRPRSPTSASSRRSPTPQRLDMPLAPWPRIARHQRRLPRPARLRRRPPRAPARRRTISIGVRLFIHIAANNGLTPIFTGTFRPDRAIGERGCATTNAPLEHATRAEPAGEDEAGRRGSLRRPLPPAQGRGLPVRAAVHGLAARRRRRDPGHLPALHDAHRPVRPGARHHRARGCAAWRATSRARHAGGARTRPIPPTSPTTPRSHEAHVDRDTPLERILRNETAEQVRRAVAAIAPHYRDVLILCELSEPELRRGRAGLRHRHRHRALAPVAGARAARRTPGAHGILADPARAKEAVP